MCLKQEVDWILKRGGGGNRQGMGVRGEPGVLGGTLTRRWVARHLDRVDWDSMTWSFVLSITKGFASHQPTD